MKYLIFVIIIISINLGYSQTYYKIYDFTPNLDHAAYQIKKLKDDEYIITFFSTCGQPLAKCCGLFTIDDEGNLLQKIQYTNFSNSTRALIVDTSLNRILYCGEEDWGTYSEEIIVNENKINDFTQSKKYKFRDQKYKYFSVSQKEAIAYNDKYVIAGTGSLEFPQVVDTSVAFMYFLNKKIELDTALYFRFEQSINNQIWDIYQDAQGYLTIHFFHNAQKNFVRILKLDKFYNVVFDWETKVTYNKNRPRGCALKDGRILVTMSNDSNPFVPEIRAINHDETTSWTYVWPKDPVNRRIVTAVNQIKNGNIIGVGSFRDSLNNQYLPFIFCISASGELLWEKAFYNYKNEISINVGQFLDFIETEQNDLIVVGFIQQGNENQDIFIVKVDENGCLYEKCDKVTGVDNIVLNSKDLDKNAEIKKIEVYPNPNNGDDIKVEIDMPNKIKYEASLYNLDGKTINSAMLENGLNRINIQNVESGMYILKIQDGSEILKIQKIIIVK